MITAEITGERLRLVMRLLRIFLVRIIITGTVLVTAAGDRPSVNDDDDNDDDTTIVLLHV